MRPGSGRPKGRSGEGSGSRPGRESLFYMRMRMKVVERPVGRLAAGPAGQEAAPDRSDQEGCPGRSSDDCRPDAARPDNPQDLPRIPNGFVSSPRAQRTQERDPGSHRHRPSTRELGLFRRRGSDRERVARLRRHRHENWVCFVDGHRLSPRFRRSLQPIKPLHFYNWVCFVVSLLGMGPTQIPQNRGRSPIRLGLFRRLAPPAVSDARSPHSCPRALSRGDRTEATRNSSVDPEECSKAPAMDARTPPTQIG